MGAVRAAIIALALPDEAHQNPGRTSRTVATPWIPSWGLHPGYNFDSLCDLYG
jgi:hypothetical protein